MADRYASLKQGLVGAWIPSISGSGLLLPDLSGRGNNGVLTNMGPDDWVSSQYGRALDFDGVNDYVNGTMQAGKEIRAVSLWLKPVSTINAASSSQALLNLRGPSSSNIFWYVAVGSSTGLLSNEYIAIQDSSSYREGIADGGSISGWTHFAASWNGTRYSLYLNGILKTSITNPSFPPTLGTTSKDHLTVAAIDNGGIPFAGQMDDIRVYERSLTPSEIRLLASRPGIGLRQEQHRQTFYQFPSGAKRRLLLTGQT